MIEYTATDPMPINLAALTTALKTALPNCTGVSSYGEERPVSIWFTGDAELSEADESATEGVLSAHDPVTLEADKTTISADGVDQAIITVRAYKEGFAPITLLLQWDENTLEHPVEMLLETGLVTISSDDPVEITVTVKDGENRCLDSIVIKAE